MFFHKKHWKNLLKNDFMKKEKHRSSRSPRSCRLACNQWCLLPSVFLLRCAQQHGVFTTLCDTSFTNFRSIWLSAKNNWKKEKPIVFFFFEKTIEKTVEQKLVKTKISSPCWKKNQWKTTNPIFKKKTYWKKKLVEKNWWHSTSVYHSQWDSWCWRYVLCHVQWTVAVHDG